MKNLLPLLPYLLGLLIRVNGQPYDCSVPPDSGSCGANDDGSKYVTRFYYSSLNLQCTEFPYSGCGGNKNNFETKEACMQACSSASAPLLRSMREAQSQRKCYYGDKFLNPREFVKTTNPCDRQCACDGRNDEMNIVCAEVDCFGDSNPSDKCYQVHTEDSCCTDAFCPENPDELKYCNVDGTSFGRDQMIYPEKYPCLQCKCTDDFKYPTLNDGTCEETDCGVLIHSYGKLLRNCTPEYYTTSTGIELCCPIGWNCEKSTENPKLKEAREKFMSQKNMAGFQNFAQFG